MLATIAHTRMTSKKELVYQGEFKGAGHIYHQLAS